MRKKYSSNKIMSDKEWENSFLQELEKVSSKTVLSGSSLYEQISTILDNNKPKFSSVEDAVNSLKERTGLSKYLEELKIQAALEEDEKLPDIFKKIPEMKVFIDNFIQDRPGTSVASVVHDLLKNKDIKEKLSPGSDIDLDVKTYINNQIVKRQNLMPDIDYINPNIGKADIDSSMVNDDPLAICEPSK